MAGSDSGSYAECGNPTCGRNWFSQCVQIVLLICYVSPATCHVSLVMYHLLPITCHQRQQPQTLPLLNFSLCTTHYTLCIMHYAPKNPKKIQTPKHCPNIKEGILVMKFIAFCLLTRSFQSTRFRFLKEGTTTTTKRKLRLIDWIGLEADSVKILSYIK